jgi:hypothetical protein
MSQKGGRIFMNIYGLHPYSQKEWNQYTTSSFRCYAWKAFYAVRL